MEQCLRQATSTKPRSRTWATLVSISPPPLIRAIVAVTEPKLGETICDPAVGSAGFLCESFDYALEALKKSLLHQAFTGEL